MNATKREEIKRSARIILYDAGKRVERIARNVARWDSVRGKLSFNADHEQIAL